MGAAWVYGLYVYFGEPYRRYPVLLSAYLSTTTDAVMTMLWLYATGGFGSPFFIALYLAVVAVAFRFHAREAFFAAGTYALAYLGLVVFLGQWMGNEGELATRIAYLFLAAGLGLVISQELRSQTASRLAMRDAMTSAQAEDARLQEAQRLAHVGSLELDVGSGRLYVSTEMRRLFGRAQGAALSLPDLLAAIHPDDRADAERELTRVLSGGGHFEIEKRILRSDGSESVLLCRGQRQDGPGRSVFRATCVDVTERVRSQERLRESQAGLAEAQRIAHVGSWSWDIPADRIAWSEELYSIFGVAPAAFEPTFEGYLGLVHPADRTLVKHHVEQAYATLRPFDFEHRVQRPDGQVRWVHSRGRVVPGPEGRPVKMTGTALDVTERVSAQHARDEAIEKMQEVEHLKRLNRLRTEFLNSAAHELATPLTPVQIQLHLLQKRAAKMSAQDRQSVGVIVRNIDRLQGLVQDLTAAALLQSSRFGLHVKEFEVRGLVEAAVAELEPVAAQKGVRIDASLPGSLPLCADEQRIHQVLSNLLTNAIKFTPVGGSIHVEATQTLDSALISVHDTGLGLTPQQRSRLFEPFSRPHEVDSSAPGTGLGLYISKGIVELHGGHLWCESEGPGRGSTFGFQLPLGPNGRPGPPTVASPLADPIRRTVPR